MTSKRFSLLCGDVSGIPATYICHVEGSTYALYEVNEWADLDSSAVETQGKYNVQAGFVDVNSDKAQPALRSCGLTFEVPTGNIIDEHRGDTIAERGSRTFDWVLAECLWGYGDKVVTEDCSGGNLRKLVALARGSL